jgi:hypothetical protein
MAYSVSDDIIIEENIILFIDVYNLLPCGKVKGKVVPVLN